jgi:hypothetical protein
VDAGVDAGAYGSIGFTLQTSTQGSTSLGWNGSDVSGSTLDSATQVTLRGSNATAGNFLLQLDNLTAGALSGQWLETSYSPESGSDSWSCTDSLSATCTVTWALSNYDGTNIAGTFTIVYGADAAGNVAQLSSGSFNVTFP